MSLVNELEAVSDEELAEMIERCRRRVQPGYFERYGMDLPAESAATLRALLELQRRRRQQQVGA
ncbi:MAG TPA: hypothetical protein VGF89_01075 [Steroidobacteraceae bacterium]|jgi:hypothetical protein